MSARWHSWSESGACGRTNYIFAEFETERGAEQRLRVFLRIFGVTNERAPVYSSLAVFNGGAQGFIARSKFHDWNA